MRSLSSPNPWLFSLISLSAVVQVHGFTPSTLALRPSAPQLISPSAPRLLSAHLPKNRRAVQVEMATELAVLASRSVILGGALAGGLHAVSGPDHFPALLPRCIGKKWAPAAKVGCLWGLGHAISAMAMGMAAFLLKEKAFTTSKWLAQLALGVDIAIGVSLIFIGFLSLQEARGRDFTADIKEGQAEGKSSVAMKVNMVMNGVFHGLALDGVPTLMPVLGVGSMGAAIAFLLSYGAGVIGAMTCATIVIGRGTSSLTEKVNFDLGKLVKGSATAAIVIGFLWTARALFFP